MIRAILFTTAILGLSYHLSDAADRAMADLRTIERGAE